MALHSDANANLQQEKGTIMKSVGVVEATPDALFDMIMSCDPKIRKQ